jgi:putative membrane protein insertion efficiency factor
MSLGRLTVRRRILAALVLLIVAIVIDLQREPASQVTSRTAIAAIHGYQATLSRWYSAMGVQCRFTPTCSHYGEACIREFGALRGGWLAARRVLRCGPWTPAGTKDPPPTLRSS